MTNEEFCQLYREYHLGANYIKHFSTEVHSGS